MNCGVVVVAAGAGRRLGGRKEKLFLPLGGKPLLARTLLSFQRSVGVDEIVLVASPAVEKRYRREVEGRVSLSKVAAVVRGGPRRQDSVYLGLLAFSSPPRLVLIHDGDRPFITLDLIAEVIEHALPEGAMAAVPAKDTIKWSEDGCVNRTLDRSRVWLAQTPQGFPYPEILAAHREARKRNREVTDDASLLEERGRKVLIIPGSYDNIKVTTPEDIELARAIYRRRQDHSAAPPGEN